MLTKVMIGFVAVFTVASIVTVTMSTQMTRQHLRDHARVLAQEQGDALNLRVQSEAAATGQLLEAAVAGVADLGAAGQDTHQLLATTHAFVRAVDPRLEIAAVIDPHQGRIVAQRPTGPRLQAPTPVSTAVLAQWPTSSVRVVPATEDGYALLHVLKLPNRDGHPLLLAVGYALDEQRVGAVRDDVGADEAVIVVAGTAVASTDEQLGVLPGDPASGGLVQSLPDGRFVQFVPLNSSTVWDTPAAVGLISPDPLGDLHSALTGMRLFLGFMLIVIGSVLTFVMARIITRPISKLTGTATAIASGELHRSFDVGLRRDEIGTLALSLEEMRRALQSQLTVIERQTEALVRSARRAVGAQDRERQRIAHNLHDGIQQRLVVLRMEVAALAERCDGNGEAVEAARAIGKTIDRVLDELRSTGQDLFPSILRDRGLGAALFSLAGRSNVPLTVHLDPDPLPRLDRDVETNAYFLASEAVANALKHASASRVDVMATYRRPILQIQVRDNGVGFDPATATATGGLLHMQDRVNALGGDLRITTAVQQGCEVTARFALDGAQLPVARTLQKKQDSRDTPVEVDLFAKSELAEDRV